MSDFTIDQVECPNKWPGRDGQPITAIVNHITQGAASSVIPHFQNPESEASTHFMVTQSGRIVQFVDVNDTAWGNGIVNNPAYNIEWLADAVHSGINLNRLTISIEHEGYTGKALTEQQYQASLWLQRKLIADHNIPVDRDHIIGHYAIDSVNRAFCPGAAFPWQRLIQDLTGADHPTFPNAGGWQDTVTGKYVAPPFAMFYCNIPNALQVIGRPIEGMTADDPRFPGLIVQWFERARFELTKDGIIQLGLVGDEALAAQQQTTPS